MAVNYKIYQSKANNASKGLYYARAAYRESVLPKAVRKRVAIEAGSADFWRKYVGLDGAVIGMSGYGSSAPAESLFKHFGFTVERVVDVARGLD